MKKIAFIFPGQGSQSQGMGLDLYNNFKSAKTVFDNADKILNKEISKICFNGDDEELKLTINSQSAIVTCSIAALNSFREICPDILPSYTLGHSLGEYCALYAANVMDFETTIKAIQKRSEVMDLATKVSKGSMTAIIGAEIEDINEGIKKASDLGIIQIANYNNKSQIVISGETEALNRACELIKEKGAKKVIPLSVSGAFHSKLMNEASEEFKNYVTNIELNNAKTPVITNIDAKITEDKEDFRKKMPIQINSSVMWYQSIENTISKGVDTFIEFGNGKILAGLNRKISSEIITYNVFDSESLKNVVSILKSEFILTQKG